MSKEKFIIEPHFRLKEWVAEEKGYFKDEGLDYVFQELIKSTDGGTTWVNASAGLPAVPISKLLVSTRDMNTVYAATWIGAYATTNGGTPIRLFHSERGTPCARHA